eukprot:2246254-Rhodomonas_salina.1
MRRVTRCEGTQCEESHGAKSHNQSRVKGQRSSQSRVKGQRSKVKGQRSNLVGLLLRFDLELLRLRHRVLVPRSNHSSVPHARSSLASLSTTYPVGAYRSPVSNARRSLGG